MAKNKHISKKKKLIKESKRTRWAPFWVIPKSFGTGRKVHPAKITKRKRNWRRNKLKI